MAAAKRSSGKGTVIALVVFIVLAFAGIGVSIWLYQQNTIIRQAAATNQGYFRREVGALFDEQNWTLDERVDSPYGFRYGEDAYRQVEQRLQDAAMLEKMRPELGWDTYEPLHEAVVNSPAQQDATHKYDDLRGLFGHYEERYQSLNDRVAKLSRDLQTTKNQLDDKTKAMDAMQKRLEKEKNQAIAEHKEAIGNLREQYNEMQQMYQETRRKLQDWQKKFDQAQKDWEQKLNKAQSEVGQWKQAYRQATRGPEKIKELKADGEVLSVEPRRELVVLAGGEDTGRKRNQTFVVYTRTPAGARKKKGTVVSNNVYETTTLATVRLQHAQLLEGDLFVPREVWNRFYGRRAEVTQPPARMREPAEKAPAQEAAPAEEPEEEPVAEEPEEGPEEEEPTAEEEEEPEEEEEEEFIFEF